MKRRALLAIGLILVLGLAFMMYIKSQSFVTMAAATLADEASQALAAEVKIGKVEIRSLNQIGVENIAVRDKAGNSVLLAERVNVKFSLLDMMRGGSLASHIKEVEVEKPLLTLAQRESGEWNYEELLSEDSGSANDFYGNVVVKGGTATVLFQNKSFVLENVEGNFDFITPPAVSFAAGFRHKGGEAKVSGSINGKGNAVSVRTENVNMEDYLAFLPEEMTIKVKRGMLKSLNVTLIEEKGRYGINGEALLLGAVLDVEGTAIEQIDGLLLFNENELRLFSRGKIKDQPLVLKGTATLDAVEPTLDMQVSSPGADINQIIGSFPLLGKVAFEAGIKGPYSNPVIQGEIRVAEGALYGYGLQGIKAKALFSDGVLAVEQISGNVAGGKVSGSGVYHADDGAYRFKIKLANLPVENFSQYAPGLAGLARGDIILEGKVGAPEQMVVFGSAAMEAGSYKNVPFERLQANFYKNKEDITVDAFSLILPQGGISAEGSLTKGCLDFSFRGSRVDLGLIGAVEPAVKISGAAEFSGTLSGSMDNPQAVIELAASDGEVFSQPYKTVKGTLRLQDNKIFADAFSFQDGKTEHVIDGFIALSGQRMMQLKAVTKSARAEYLIKPFLSEDFTGNVNNVALISGSLEEPLIEGELDFYEGSFRGVFIKSVRGGYQWKNGRLFLRDFFVSAPNLKVKLDGELKKDGGLDFTVAADEIDFGKVNLKLPYPASGIGSFNGKVCGTLTDPEFSGRLFASELNFNGRALTDVDGQVSFKDQRLDVASVGFKQGRGAFNLSGGFDLPTDKLYGSLLVKDGSLAAILALAGIEDGWLAGDLNGSVLLAGTLAKPYIHLNGTVAEGSIKQAPLRNLSLDVVVNGKAIQLNEFKAEQNEGILVAKGKLDLDGSVDLECSGDNIDAGLLLRLGGMDADLQGSLNFGAQVSGAADNPKVDLSVDVKNGGNGKTSFDTLYGMFRLEDGIIQVEQLLAQKDIYKISAYGVIPLAALLKKGQTNTALKDQMDLKVALDQADLSILPLLTDNVSWAAGETKGSVNISGTLSRPLFHGEILLDGGAVKFDGLGKPLEGVALDIKFLGDRLELRKFEGNMGKGSFQMNGSSRIDGDGLQGYEFHLGLNQLEVANKYYTGPLQGQLTLSQDKLREHTAPKIAGALEFANCTFDIPPIPESEEEMPKIKLDLAVNLGKKVRLYNPFLYDIWLGGYAKFEGSTRWPQALGEITALRGTVNYLKTPFKIKEASAYFNQVSSFLPSLHLEADTRLQRTKVYMSVDGPADQLKIKLNSDPQMPEAELLTLLTLRSKYDRGDQSDGGGIGKDELMAFVDIGLQMSFLSEVENVMRNALGVDEFKVVRETLSGGKARDEEEGYNLEIGKYIDDKIMLRYITGVDGNDEYKFGVRYDLNNHISLTTDVDQDNKKFFGIEARFKF